MLIARFYIDLCINLFGFSIKDDLEIQEDDRIFTKFPLEMNVTRVQTVEFLLKEDS